MAEDEQSIAQSWREFIARLLEEPDASIRDYLRLRQSAGMGRFTFWGNHFFLAGARGGQGLPVTRIMTKKAWMRAGRVVRPDALRLTVFAIFNTRPGRASLRRGYAERHYVEYDIQDTDDAIGAAAPQLILEAPPPVEVDEGSVAQLTSRFDAWREQGGPFGPIALTTDPPDNSVSPAAMGATNGRWIYLRPDLPPFQRAHVYAHEVAHIVLGHLGNDPSAPLVDGPFRVSASAAVQEVEADVTALLVCAMWGIDVIQHTRHYLAHWQPKRMKIDALADRVLTAVREIVEFASPPARGESPLPKSGVRDWVRALQDAIEHAPANREAIIAYAASIISPKYSPTRRRVLGWYLSETLRHFEGRFWEVVGARPVNRSSGLEFVSDDSIRWLRPYPLAAAVRGPATPDGQIVAHPLFDAVDLLVEGNFVRGRWCYQADAKASDRTVTWRILALSNGDCVVERRETQRLRQPGEAVVIARCPGWCTTVRRPALASVAALDNFLMVRQAAPIFPRPDTDRPRGVVEERNIGERACRHEVNAVRRALIANFGNTAWLAGLERRVESAGRGEQKYLFAEVETVRNFALSVDTEHGAGVVTVQIESVEPTRDGDFMVSWSGTLFAPASHQDAERLLREGPGRGVALGKRQTLLSEGTFDRE